LRVSEFFVVEVAACSKSHGVLPSSYARRSDAGAQTRNELSADVTAAGVDGFAAEGLLLHMPGVWEFRFDLRGAGADEIVRERISLRDSRWGVGVGPRKATSTPPFSLQLFFASGTAPPAIRCSNGSLREGAVPGAHVPARSAGARWPVVRIPAVFFARHPIASILDPTQVNAPE